MQEIFGQDQSMLNLDVDSCKFALSYILQDEILNSMKNHLSIKIINDIEREHINLK